MSGALFIEGYGPTFAFSRTRWRLFSPEMRESTGPYKQSIDLPRCPVFHPYNPLGNSTTDARGKTITNARIDAGVPKFSLVVKLAMAMHPTNVDVHLAANGIDPANIDYFIVMQNNPWQDEPLLLRPHPWLHAGASEYAEGYNVTSNIVAASTRVGQPFFTVTDSIVTHSGAGADHEVVYSPNNLYVPTIEDFTKTHIIYSLCIDPTAGRAAITLHYILNDLDQKSVDVAIDALPHSTTRRPFTLDKFTEILANSAVASGQLIDLRPIYAFDPTMPELQAPRVGTGLAV